MTDDEVAAVHEAAHAVFAHLGPWTKLVGAIGLIDEGGGDVTMSTDLEAIRRSIAAEPRFDRDGPRIHLICSLLAGPIVERMLVERGCARLDEEELASGSDPDYRIVAAQLDQLVARDEDLLTQLERDVRRKLEQPAIWSAIERFATILLERRRMHAEEASAILDEILALPDRRGLSRVWRTSLVGLAVIAATAIGPVFLMQEMSAAHRIAGTVCVLVGGVLLSLRLEIGRRHSEI